LVTDYADKLVKEKKYEEIGDAMEAFTANYTLIWPLVFPIANRADFEDALVDFVQNPMIKFKDGGNGVLETYLGIDYNSLAINPDYELIPTKPEYEELAGACVVGAGEEGDFTLSTETDIKGCKMQCDFNKAICRGYEEITPNKEG
jgi:hypothetical protein